MENIDAYIAAISRPHAGVFTLDMARAGDISKNAIYRRVRRGTVVQLHPRTFFVGSVVTLDARRWAAVLAAGPDALLGGAAAEDEWNIARWPNNAVEVVVTVRQRPLDSVDIVHTRTLHDEDRATCNGRPTTTVERTLVEIAARRSVGYLCRALREATFRSNLEIGRLERTIDRNWNRHGIGKLRCALHRHVDGHGGTDSGIEDRFSRLLDRAGIIGYATNVELAIQGVVIRVDVFIEHLDLVIEIDPPWHLDDAVTREDSLRGALCRSDGRNHLRVPDNKLRWGVRQVVRMQREWEASQVALVIR